MRSPNVSAAKPEGAFRILMLGDSTLYGGSYIDQAELYASRLEDLLNQNPGVLPNSPKRVEVLCMGVNGWGPQHELAYVQKFGVFDADLAMVMGPPNDAYRPRYGLEPLPFYAEGRRPRWAWQEFWDRLMWEHRLRSSGAVERAEASEASSEFVDAGVTAWLGIVSLAQKQGAGVDFELLPNEEEAREGRPADSTQRVLNALLPKLMQARVPNAYPLALFRRNLGAPKLFHDGAHLGKVGHKIYAEYLRDRVLQLVNPR
jgi:hypothetical protein